MSFRASEVNCVAGGPGSGGGQRERGKQCVRVAVCGVRVWQRARGWSGGGSARLSPARDKAQGRGGIPQSISLPPWRGGGREDFIHP